jgi:hypothetical protein
MSRFETYDKRKKQFFMVEFDEFDSMTKYEYLVYSYLLRYANHKSAKAYMTSKACFIKLQISPRIYKKSIDSLIAKNIVKHVETPRIRTC